MNFQKQFTTKELEAMEGIKQKFPEIYKDFQTNLLRMKIAAKSLNKNALNKIMREQLKLVESVYKAQ